MEYKKAYARVTDGYGLIGIWRFSKGKLFVLLVFFLLLLSYKKKQITFTRRKLGF